MPRAKTTSSSTVHVDRKRLLTALTRIGWVTPNHTYKPVLQGVRLEASDGKLRLSATDAEVSLSTTFDAEGDLPRCLVSCPELTKRLKAGKGDTCAIRLEPKGDAIVVNGGRVDHTIRTMDLQDHPPVSTEPDGKAITLSAPALKDALSIALVAAATETSRYAIQGVLLESDKAGTRFVATDGRRLVMTELDPSERQFHGKVIIPSRVAWLVGKLIDSKATGDVHVFVKEDPGTDRAKQPAEVYVVGPDWILASPELEGHFPLYRDVVPKSHSQFIVDRVQFMETLAEVAVSTDENDKAVRLDLGRDSVRLSAHSSQVGESSATIPASFAGGGDAHIITGFNPQFLVDAAKNLPGEHVVIDVAQNRPDLTTGKVFACPALLYGLDHAQVRWVIMPLNLGLPASRETLGSNFEDDKQAETPPVSTAPLTPNAKTGSKRRRTVQHEWPEVGAVLEGTYEGQTYTAVVVNAPRLKSGRAIQVTSGPVAGRTFNSMSAAMVAATAEQRRELGLGVSKKGLPASGWDFWRPAPRKRASA